MKIVNRGFISVQPKQAYWDWANEFENEFDFSEHNNVEPNIYLIEDDFMEVEPLIEQNFKEIFSNELSVITENKEDWPKSRILEDFLNWFEIDFGTTVFDLKKSDLKRYDLD